MWGSQGKKEEAEERGRSRRACPEISKVVINVGAPCGCCTHHHAQPASKCEGHAHHHAPRGRSSSKAGRPAGASSEEAHRRLLKSSQASCVATRAADSQKKRLLGGVRGSL
jgi:hypothetical protein